MTKIIYELDSREEQGELQIIQNAWPMYMALIRLRDYARDLYKGYKEFEEEKVIDTLHDIVYESKIDEVP